MIMKKGYHTWPFSGKVHPVGEQHKTSQGKIQGSETKNFNYRFPKSSYKEGK